MSFNKCNETINLQDTIELTNIWIIIIPTRLEKWTDSEILFCEIIPNHHHHHQQLQRATATIKPSLHTHGYPDLRSLKGLIFNQPNTYCSQMSKVQNKEEFQKTVRKTYQITYKGMTIPENL